MEFLIVRGLNFIIVIPCIVLAKSIECVCVWGGGGRSSFTLTKSGGGNSLSHTKGGGGRPKSVELVLTGGP